MQGAKAYALPLVAGLVLLGYWLFAPSVDTSAVVQPAAAPVSSAPSPDEARTRTLAQITEAIGPAPSELPAEIRDRHATVVAAAVSECTAHGGFEVTLVGAPGLGTLVAAARPLGPPDPPSDACVQRVLDALRLPAPPAPGRAVLTLDPA